MPILLTSQSIALQSKFSWPSFAYYYIDTPWALNISANDRRWNWSPAGVKPGRRPPGDHGDGRLMTRVSLTLEEIRDLATRAFSSNGCDEANTRHSCARSSPPSATAPVARPVPRAGVRHFAAQRQGQRQSRPEGEPQDAGDRQRARRQRLCAARDRTRRAGARRGRQEIGIAVMAVTHTHHFAALWPETEGIAAHGLIGMACVCYMPFWRRPAATSRCSVPIPSLSPGRGPGRSGGGRHGDGGHGTRRGTDRRTRGALRAPGHRAGCQRRADHGSERDH